MINHLTYTKDQLNKLIKKNFKKGRGKSKSKSKKSQEKSCRIKKALKVKGPGKLMSKKGKSKNKNLKNLMRKLKKLHENQNFLK